MMKILGLTKRYHKKSVISGINLTLEKENYGLVGPNGAGKTTLIRMLAGVIQPTSGEIIYDSGKSVGYLSQKFGCIPELTVFEQMEYFACLKKISNKNQRDEINNVLSMVNLEEKRNEKCKNLSGGMVRRLGIGQALLGRPELLLLDEPTAGLDPDERKAFADIIGNLKGTMTIVLSTHIINDIKNTCDKMLVLERGVLAGVIDLEKYNGSDIEDLYFKVLRGTGDK